MSIPPFPALRAFVETGLCGSMKAAAEHLNVTPGAVSQSIAALEASLGVKLFERLNREVRLTREGQSLLEDLSEAFALIENGLDKLRGERADRSRLVVSTTNAFAATWLVPRLGRFTSANPAVDVRVQTTPELVALGFQPQKVQVAIRHGLGSWPGHDVQPLLKPRLIPVGHPELLASGPPIAEPIDCLAYPLLHDPDALDWSLWMRAVTGKATRDPRLTTGPRFADSALLVRAALSGQGLALVRDAYVEDDLAAGRLRLALDHPWPASFAYYIVTRPGARARSQNIGAFVDWLLDEAEREAVKTHWPGKRREFLTPRTLIFPFKPRAITTL